MILSLQCYYYLKGTIELQSGDILVTGGRGNHMHHRIGVEVVRFEIIMCIKFQSKVTNDKFRLQFGHKILTRAAIIVRSL